MENYLDMARDGKNNLWRYILGIVIILTVFYGYGIIVPESVDTWGPLGNYLIQDFSYILYFLAVVFIIKFIHKRSFRSLLTPKKSLNWKLMGVGFAIYFVLMFLFSLLPQYLADPSAISLTPDLWGFLIFLPFLLILVPIQTTSEELFFRGYLLQATGFLSRNFILLAILNGILFMLPHLANPEVAQAPLTAITDWVVFGFVMAYLTLKSGTLELAIAAHASNNLFITVVSNYQGSVFSTPSLLVTSTYTF
ncbi:MAG: CPBP family intramembrane metalloprotease [Methanobacterium sp.]|nr:CPBP family intramembrane metalloprotease [Methanobacterium sp.]